MVTKYKLVIFDLDGTLIDTMGGFADLAGSLLSDHYGYSFEEGRKRYLETSGVPFFQQMEILFKGDGRNKAVVEEFERRKISSFLNETISEKTRETLLTLRDREIKTVISSNNFHDLVTEFVQREDIPIDLALGFKPNFEKGLHHFEHIRRHLGFAFPAMMFVGDSLKDAEKSQEEGIRFVAKIGTFSLDDFRLVLNSQPLLTISEIYEILNILEIE